MTLAVFLLIIIPFMAPPAGAQQPASAGQDQKPPASTSAPPSSQESTPKTPAKPPSAAKKVHKKKPANPDCNDPSPGARAAGATSAASPETPGAGASGKTGQSSGAPQSCPPPKIIVRQGGTTEPSIQLAGGPSVDAAAQKRDAITQLLGTTDQNLKKASERQLTSVQQDTVTQTRQFMEQSKQAMADGDLDRARTLAWKAEVLSEDLVKPEK